MKLVVAVRLFPDGAQEAALRDTLALCNRAANYGPGQARFCCTSCGFAEHADVNAARNVAQRGVAGWAAVSQPHAA